MGKGTVTLRIGGNPNDTPSSPLMGEDKVRVNPIWQGGLAPSPKPLPSKGGALAKAAYPRPR